MRLAVFSSVARGKVLCAGLVVAAAIALPNWAPAGTGEQSKALRFRPTDSKQDRPVSGGDLYALVVGVSKYQHTKISKLQLSAKDAKDFAEFLKTQTKVFRNLNVTLMLDEEATKKNVEKYLFGKLKQAGKNDTVVLFFSGHGGEDPKSPGNFFFLTQDAEPDHCEATAVKMSGLSFVENVEAARVVVIADACHAGGWSETKTKSIEQSLDGFVKEFAQSEGRVVLTSSRANQKSIEKEGMPNSVFTHYMLQGLKGEADSNRDGVVSVKEIYDYVYHFTKAETDGAQHPQFEGKLVGNIPLSVLGELKSPLELEVWFVAQDPRCKNHDCINPSPGSAVCNDPLCGDVTITDGSTMYSGQNYQIGFRPSSRSYVYVFHLGPKGDIYQLFPGRDYLAPDNKIENPLDKDKIYWIPSQDAWLHHDEQVGKEKIYVVASRGRNNQLEDLYGSLARNRNQGDREAVRKINYELGKTLEKTMAPTKVIRAKARMVEQPYGLGRGKVTSFEEFSHLIQSAGLDVVRSVWFHHKNR